MIHDSNPSSFSAPTFPASLGVNTSDFSDTGLRLKSTIPPQFHVSVELRQASTIEFEAIDWFCEGWLARRKIHVIAGQAGTGKSTITVSTVATLTRGGALRKMIGGK
jgi:hypothetical protein